MRLAGRTLLHVVIGLAAIAGMAVALLNLYMGLDGVVVTQTRIGDVPATIFKPVISQKAPAIIIAHGFAGSQQLMRPFALTLARNGYVAVTFDFPGHGRNPAPLAGDIARVEGATTVLVDAMAQMAAVTRGLGDGRLAVLGHSMASDIVVRFAEQTPDVAATVAVSMFSPAVTKDAPRNLLIITGSLESFLRAEALRAVSLAVPDGQAQEGLTYGDPGQGSGRRAAVSGGVEHIGVLYSHDSMTEALGWLDATFAIHRDLPAKVDASGPMILLLLGSLVVLAWPLSKFLPRTNLVPVGVGCSWREAWPGLLLPAILTPFVLRFLPTHFLPVIVGDYLAAHFAAYGLILASYLAFRSKLSGRELRGFILSATFLMSAVAYIFYSLGVLGLAVDCFVTSFVVIPSRIPLILALFVGTLAFFLADELFTRGPGVAKGLYAASKLAFLLSLGIAVAIDFERLFFLAIIIPVIIPLLLVYGLFSSWAYTKTQNPLVASLGNSIAFAWAIGVTFPMLAS